MDEFLQDFRNLRVTIPRSDLGAFRIDAMRKRVEQSYCATGDDASRSPSDILRILRCSWVVATRGHSWGRLNEMRLIKALEG